MILKSIRIVPNVLESAIEYVWASSNYLLKGLLEYQTIVVPGGFKRAQSSELAYENAFYKNRTNKQSNLH